MGRRYVAPPFTACPEWSEWGGVGINFPDRPFLKMWVRLSHSWRGCRLLCDRPPLREEVDHRGQSPSSEKSVRQQSLIRLFLAVLSLGLLFLYVQMRSQPVPARGSEVAADEFSAGRAFDLLGDLLAEEVPHPVESEANQRIRQRIEDQLDALGYQTEVQRTENCIEGACATVENVIGRLPGATEGTTGGPALMLVAHYDSVPAGPGVGDNGSGVATLLETARILQAEGPFRNTLLFLFTDGEELALNGAHAFVDEHPLAQEVGVVINLEARGSSGASIMFETSEGNGWLLRQFSQVARRPTASSLFFEIYKILPNDTDLTVFKKGGMAGYGFAFMDDVINYHQPSDNLQNLNLNTLQHHGENTLNLARHLANADLAQAKSGNLIYTDVLSLFVVRYPIWLGQTLAATLLLTLFGLAIVLGKQERISLMRVAIGIGGVIGVLLLPLLLLVVPEDLWAGFPLARLLIVLIVVVIVYGISAILAARVRALDVSIATWILWTLLALLLALLLPGVSIIFFLPALCAVLLHLLLLWKPSRGQIVFYGSMICSAIIWLKLAILFDIALSISTGPAIIAFPLALLASTALPFLIVSTNSAPDG